MLVYPGIGVGGGRGFSFAGGTATAASTSPASTWARNVIIARASDLAGNVGSASIAYTATAARILGHVARADGGDAAGVPVQIENQAPLVADASGRYSLGGQRPGGVAVRATDPDSGFQATRAERSTTARSLVLDLTLPRGARSWVSWAGPAARSCRGERERGWALRDERRGRLVPARAVAARLLHHERPRYGARRPGRASVT